jgi:hypothetical protein
MPVATDFMDVTISGIEQKIVNQNQGKTVVNLFRNTVNDVRNLSTCPRKQVTAVATGFMEVTISGKGEKNANQNQ